MDRKTLIDLYEDRVFVGATVEKDGVIYRIADLVFNPTNGEIEISVMLTAVETRVRSFANVTINHGVRNEHKADAFQIPAEKYDEAVGVLKDHFNAEAPKPKRTRKTK